MVLTGAADNTARLWDCETGKEIAKYETSCAVRTCGFSVSGSYLMYSTDATMNNTCEIVLCDVRDKEASSIRLVKIFAANTMCLRSRNSVV